MRPMFAWVSVALLLVGCDGPHTPSALRPLQVSTIVAPPPPSFPPFSERYSQIVAGQMVSRSVTADDPPCAEYPEFRCQYFRITPPSDGRLDVAMTSTLGAVRQPLDLSMRASRQGPEEWWHPISASVRAGSTYQLTVWYGTPGVEFQLRSSLSPN